MNREFLHAFQSPPPAYSAVPFWFLNDDLKPESLRQQLCRMKEAGVYACIVHARKGMEIPYLSEDWFARVGCILEEAERLSMEIWIYDEDNWPSGYAGGGVIERRAEFAASCLSMEKIFPVLGRAVQVPDVPEKALVGVIAVWHNEKFCDITELIRQGQGWTPPSLQWEVFVLRREVCGHCPAYSHKPYVDLLNPEAVKTFIALTHAEYKRRFPQYWGTVIKGFFTDEPGFYQNYLYQTRNLNTIPWSEGLPQFFKARRGYDLLPVIGALWDDMGDFSRKVRHDFYRTFTELYNQSFFRQIYEFCDKDGLQSIGHLHMEEHLSDTVQMEGHFFEDMRYLHVPGIDRIDRERRRITEKLGSSAMHLYGRERCFSETYGCFGWGLTLAEMKAEADWQFVQGINMLVPHAFFSSIEGIRKFESPPSLFYQNPYWPHFRQFASYIQRLSWILTQGTYCAELLVYYPITSCWELFRPLSHAGVDRLDEALIGLCETLLQNQLDFDFVDDAALEERAVVEAGALRIGKTAYRCVVLPPIANIPLRTVETLAAFAEGGGTVITTGEWTAKAAVPEDDRKAAALWARLSACGGLVTATCGEIPARCRELGLQTLALQAPAPHIKYMRRKTEDGTLYFLVNEAATSVCHTVTVPESGCAWRLDPETGTCQPFQTVRAGDGLSFPLVLPPQGSLLVLFEEDGARELFGWRIALPDGTEREAVLGDWRDFGLAEHAGSLLYMADFELSEITEVHVDLGKVCDIAELSVNGHSLPVRCWPPFTFNVTPYVHIGKNALQVRVTNTLANALMEQKVPSGLYGPVKLYNR